MPTILRLKGWRVHFYSNDHGPAHVHVSGPDREFVFDLNCLDGPVAVTRNHRCSPVEVNWIEGELNRQLSNSVKAGGHSMATTEAFDSASRRGQQLQNEYAAKRAFHDKRTGKVVVELSSGWEIGFPPAAVQGLENATATDLDQMELSPSRLGLHFPTLDVDLSIPALFHQKTGSKQWMARQLGKAGGSVVSERKASAARENGKRGGRPPRQPATSR